jgi:hypothetical protein
MGLTWALDKNSAGQIGRKKFCSEYQHHQNRPIGFSVAQFTRLNSKTYAVLFQTMRRMAV